MTKAELESEKEALEQELETVKAENEQLRKIVAECYEPDEVFDDEYEQECLVNRIVAERLAEEDRRNDECAKDDELFAYELQCIRYLESRYDDDYGCW